MSDSPRYRMERVGNELHFKGYDERDVHSLIGPDGLKTNISRLVVPSEGVSYTESVVHWRIPGVNGILFRSLPEGGIRGLSLEQDADTDFVRKSIEERFADLHGRRAASEQRLKTAINTRP